MSKINKIDAREIIDSRGNPTIEVSVILNCGSITSASVPSGASVGKNEAFELRDGDIDRYRGLGVLKAVDNVKNQINNSLKNKNPLEQSTIDNILIDLDGSKNKSNIGANAILATSLAIARAGAFVSNLPLYKYINNDCKNILPIPMMNIINGGAHADNMLDLQEFMISPVNAKSFKEAVRIASEIFHNLKLILKSSNHSTSVGDEGGFAPNIDSSENAIKYIIKAIEKSGYIAGEDIYISIDAAASEIYENNMYHIKGEDKILNKYDLVSYYKNLTDTYPIYSIEDPFSEDDTEGWTLITKELGNRIQLVGDDLIVTNKQILKNIIDQNIANAVLIKPNQIGTLTETLETIDLAHKSGYRTIVSHRSGETEDNFISHLVVATDSGQIKAGSLSRTDRVAKYNELIRIEDEIGIIANYQKFWYKY